MRTLSVNTFSGIVLSHVEGLVKSMGILPEDEFLAGGHEGIVRVGDENIRAGGSEIPVDLVVAEMEKEFNRPVIQLTEEEYTRLMNRPSRDGGAVSLRGRRPRPLDSAGLPSDP